MQFQKKPYVIEAIGVPYILLAEHPYELEEIPDWLQKAFDDRLIIPRIDTKPYWCYEIRSNRRVLGRRATPNDWFILEPDGAIDSISNEELEKKYIPKPKITYTLISANYSFHQEKDTFTGMPTTPSEAPIGHPEPPHETNAGKDSTPAPALAEVAEDQLIAEEESNPT